MFTKRHEQELAEIKALTHEIGQRFEEVLKELEGIKDTQDQLAARDRQGARGKRATGSDEAQAAGADGTPESDVTSAKRARRREPSAPVAVAAGAKAGKRRGKTGPDDRAARKRAGGGRKRRQTSEPSPSSDSDED